MKQKKNIDYIEHKIKYQVGAADRTISIITYIVYAFFAFACVYPFYYIFINSISDNTLSAKGKIIFLPHGIHFNNYVQVLELQGLFTSLWNSLARTVLGTLLTVVASAFLGYMFTRETMWHRKLWFRLIAVTMYFNAGIIPWYLVMSRLGLRNNFLIYILPTIIQPFNIILCKTFVEGVPGELMQAAEIDGAGTMRVFFNIVLPVIKPIVATVAIFSAVAQWNSFQDTLLMITNEKLYTLQYTLYQYLKSSDSLKALISSSQSAESIANIIEAHQQTNTSVQMTVTIIVVAPIIMVYPFFQRYFTKGIMIGAVKG